jgi:GTP-binding protein
MILFATPKGLCPSEGLLGYLDHDGSHWMKIKAALFMKSAVTPNDYPQPGHPEIAFAGRSNVGKSSLINCLVHRSRLAKTSSTPGKTRCLNFFLVNSTLSLVDLPGYGFAKVPERVRKHWGSMIETYLRNRDDLRLVVILIDARRKPTGQDLQLFEWLRHYRIPAIAVATKIDKISRAKRQRQIQEIRGCLCSYKTTVIPFSATTREGRARVWNEITRVCKASSSPEAGTVSSEKINDQENGVRRNDQGLSDRNS